jgi:Fic family protein
MGFQYTAYVPDPIADLEISLPGDVAAVVTEAELAVRELNQTSIRLEPLETLARQLLRAESVASSRIEGLEVSHRRLAMADYSDDLKDVTAQSVLANMRAMELAIRRASSRRPFRVSDVLAIHRELFCAFDDPSAGRVRHEQNWIGGASSSPRDAEFVPPPAELVPDLLDDLCRYLQRDDLPAVAQAATVHAQFETIHPFADGNGRVGRCLIHVVLRRRGVAPKYVPPISLILATNSKAYVAGLTDFRSGKPAEWCAVFAQATREAAGEARRFAEHIADLKVKWRSAAGDPRRDSAATALIEQLPSHPIIDVASAEQLLRRSNQAVRLAMQELEDSGVVRKLTTGRRNRAWEAAGLFDLINHFESHLATRRGGRTRLRPAPRSS